MTKGYEVGKGKLASVAIGWGVCMVIGALLWWLMLDMILRLIWSD